MVRLIHDFIFASARRAPKAAALSHQGAVTNYAALAQAVQAAASALLGLGLQAGERVAVYLETRPEAVSALFGTAAAGGVFVPINPLLKAAQVGHILADSAARILVTSRERLAQLDGVVDSLPDLCAVIVVQGQVSEFSEVISGADDLLPQLRGLHCLGWQHFLMHASERSGQRRLDDDMAAILYTSGSSGKPTGVMLSHRHLVNGALEVADYLGNVGDDRLLCLLPLSVDYGLSQLTTAFASGACAVLMHQVLLRDIVETVAAERITGLAAVPPLWHRLAQLRWPSVPALRYITSSGDVMHRATLDKLRAMAPRTEIYLMYGLTEVFRSTYLAPEQRSRLDCAAPHKVLL